MIGDRLVVLSLLALVGVQTTLVSFPPDFKFGAASAAYQVEGGWNASDKSASVWDVFTHRRRDKVLDGSDGDVSCDSYHLWRRDIQMAKELGLDFYRFSVSWSRICPNGFCNAVSKDGLRYYSQLIDALLDEGIEPVLTMYHWDLPQRIQDLGGWANPLIADWFANYASVLFKAYADRVKTWITINEPMILCDGVYSGYLAPIIEDAHYGAYLCSKNILLAHAKAWRIYDQEFRPKYHGQIALVNHLIWFEPYESAEQGLADLALEHCVSRFSHPIYSKEGGWPPVLEKLIEENSRKQGFPRSRLPVFTKEEIELVRGTYDFYAVNYYTSREVHSAKPGERVGPFPILGFPEINATFHSNPQWKDSTLVWLKQNAKGLRNLLKWLKHHYGDLTFLILENGLPTPPTLTDDNRVQYIKDHLTQVYLAINEDGVKVKAYTVWSLMDNYEWRSGYIGKFGLFEVNFTDPLRKRTARASAHYYSNVIATHTIDVEGSVTTTSNTIWIVLLAGLVVLIVAGVGIKYLRDKNRSNKSDYASVAMNERDLKTSSSS